MQTKTILINGKKAVPIPDEVLEQCPLGEEVDVSVVQGGVLVSATTRKPRDGWAEALQNISQAELDRDHEELRDFREMPDDWANQKWHWPESTTDEKV